MMSKRMRNHGENASRTLDTILFALVTFMISALIVTLTASSYLRGAQNQAMDVGNIVLLTIALATLPLIICVKMLPPFDDGHTYLKDTDES